MLSEARVPCDKDARIKRSFICDAPHPQIYLPLTSKANNCPRDAYHATTLGVDSKSSFPSYIFPTGNGPLYYAFGGFAPPVSAVNWNSRETAARKYIHQNDWMYKRRNLHPSGPEIIPYGSQSLVATRHNGYQTELQGETFTGRDTFVEHSDHRVRARGQNCPMVREGLADRGSSFRYYQPSSTGPHSKTCSCGCMSNDRSRAQPFKSTKRKTTKHCKCYDRNHVLIYFSGANRYIAYHKQGWQPQSVDAPSIQKVMAVTHSQRTPK